MVTTTSGVKFDDRPTSQKSGRETTSPSVKKDKSLTSHVISKSSFKNGSMPDLVQPVLTDKEIMDPKEAIYERVIIILPYK